MKRRLGIAVLAAVVACAVGATVARFGAAYAESKSQPAPAGSKRAVFAGGCFWCMETAYEGVAGISAVVSGYAGGQKDNPSYEEVGGGRTGHAEVVEVTYDPAKITYAKLLDIFWHNVDPHSGDGQFCDRGSQYRPAIFALDDEQLKVAQASKTEIEKSGKLKSPIVVGISKITKFYPAEDYHQDFYKKDPIWYKSYRLGCGRDRRLKDVWGDAAGGSH